MIRVLVVLVMLAASAPAFAQEKKTVQDGPIKVTGDTFVIDEAKGEVRSVDQEWTVEWRAGVPTLSLSAEAFRGQKVEMSFGTAIGFREDFSPGVIYEYRFQTGEIKTPLQETALKHGWRWQGVAFGKL